VRRAIAMIISVIIICGILIINIIFEMTSC
jgi:hypothetical protein